MTIKIWFKSGCAPWTLEGVSNIVTEESLIRIVYENEKSDWFPVMEVFRIKEI